MSRWYAGIIYCGVENYSNGKHLWIIDLSVACKSGKGSGLQRKLNLFSYVTRMLTNTQVGKMATFVIVGRVALSVLQLAHVAVPLTSDRGQ